MAASCHVYQSSDIVLRASTVHSGTTRTSQTDVHNNNLDASVEDLVPGPSLRDGLNWSNYASSVYTCVMDELLK
jgi:hypothetical protein